MELSSIESAHQLVVDDESGLLCRLRGRGSSDSWETDIAISLKVDVDGEERRGSTGGLEYFGTQQLTRVRAAGAVRWQQTPEGQVARVPIEVSAAQDGATSADSSMCIHAEFVYRFNRLGPGVSLGIDFAGRQHVVVRNVVLDGDFDLGDANWLVTAPGNGLRTATSLSALSGPVGVSPVGGLRGSSGLVHVESSVDTRAVALWFDNDVEIGEIELRATQKSLAFTLTSNFAADLADTTSNEVDLVSIDLGVPKWAQFAARFSGWLSSRGLTAPGQPPEWIVGAMIYEAQIGFSVFGVTNRYSPYPEVEQLINDLDRIDALGFSVIQLMPRQPYPSYNIHDYWDIETSYGHVEQLRDLVTQCHRRGIRLILDVLLHGVLDQESIGTAADGVRSGPYANLVASETSDSFSADVNDWTNYLIAWSRHILDFEPYWLGGSPAVSPLVEQHPDWFCRDSAGNVTGVYTKAFDARNRTWQDWFTSAMTFLMTELDIDGFRFDAPTYNDFPNWAPWARGRAGSSALACVSLFERLRPVLKSVKADALLYTEPSGHALRRSMDLNYNYDEQWLVTALAEPASVKPWGVATAKGFATWMRDPDALLPVGSMTAHHIDSHDTFWWPTWGKKWRREQFGIELARLLTLVFGSLPGPFMMFSGGEVGIEDLLPRLSALKATAEFRDGTVSWWTGDDVAESVFGLTRASDDGAISVLANFSNEVVDVPLSEERFEVRFSVGGVEPLVGGVRLGALSGVVWRHGPANNPATA